VLKIIALAYQRCIRACHSEESLRLDEVSRCQNNACAFLKLSGFYIGIR
jgi:hypothetical protein